MTELRSFSKCDQWLLFLQQCASAELSIFFTCSVQFVCKCRGMTDPCERELLCAQPDSLLLVHAHLLAPTHMHWPHTQARTHLLGEWGRQVQAVSCCNGRLGSPSCPIAAFTRSTARTLQGSAGPASALLESGTCSANCDL